VFFAPKLYKGTARGQKHGKRTKFDIINTENQEDLLEILLIFYCFVLRNGQRSFPNFFVRVIGGFIDSLRRRRNPPSFCARFKCFSGTGLLQSDRVLIIIKFLSIVDF